MNDIYDVKWFAVPTWFWITETLVFFGLCFLVLLYYLIRTTTPNRQAPAMIEKPKRFDAQKALQRLSKTESTYTDEAFLQKINDIFRTHTGLVSESLEEIQKKDTLSKPQLHFFTSVYVSEYREQHKIDRQKIITDFLQIL